MPRNVSIPVSATILSVRELVIPPAVLDWLADAVLSSDRTEQAVRAETIRKLQARYDQIEARIETMYMDKLDGRITQEFFDKQAGVYGVMSRTVCYARSKISRRPRRSPSIRPSTCFA
jgi:hypothetical protein